MPHGSGCLVCSSIVRMLLVQHDLSKIYTAKWIQDDWQLERCAQQHMDHAGT